MSNFFNSIGLGGIDLGIVVLVLLVLLIVSIVITIINMVKLNKLTQRYNLFMRGKAAKSLENEVIRMFEDNTMMQQAIKNNTRDIKNIKKQLSGVFQKMAIVKYDAFNQMGGKLSFCLALLDEFDNGFLLNSVHSTDSSYVYVKRIEDGRCNLELGSEEEAAVKKAVEINVNETSKGN